ncbi:DEAD-box ATP-dependent RNA helicase 52C-like protein [Tanacetum coccineum]
MSYSYFSDSPSSYSQVTARPPRHSNYIPPHQRPVDPTRPYRQPTPFSEHQNHRQNHRPYTGNNYHRPYTFNSYDPLSENFNQQLNLKQETHVGNNLKQETHEVENENSGVINFEAYEDIPVEVTGSEVPDPVHLFTDIDLGGVLNENIRVRCKYVKPTPIQRHAIPVVMGGRDLMACAQTGSGKTAAFCFPIISGVLKMGLGNGGGFGRVASPLALVLSPTRELCCQADRICRTMGFEPPIRRLWSDMDMPPLVAQTNDAFHATFPSENQRLASDFLSNYIFLSVGRVGSSADLIQQKIMFVEEMDKKDHLRNLLQEQKDNGNLGKNSLTLIFVGTKRSADIARKLALQGRFPATRHTTVNKGNFFRVNDKLRRCCSNGISELMKEAKQETPDWLAQYAESYAASANQRHGSSKFGGRDIRELETTNTILMSNNASLMDKFRLKVACGGLLENTDYGATTSDSYDNSAPPPAASDFSGSFTCMLQR